MKIILEAIVVKRDHLIEIDYKLLGKQFFNYLVVVIGLVVWGIISFML